MQPTVPPEEVLAPPGRDEDYVAWRAQTDLRAPYRVAPEFLKGTKKDAAYDLDECPLIVFINARSGGRVGPELANKLARALGRSQVFDLATHRPDTVLQQIWRNFDEQERRGNPHAALVRQRIRILACGGDGTVAWIMKVIHQLDLKPQPAVGIMPLGTGNDLSRSFHWGPEFEWSWIKGHASIYATLKKVADARVTDLDCWRVRLTMPDASYKPLKTYALSEVPMQQQEQPLSVQPNGVHYSPVAEAAAAGNVLLEGMFWNYFSVGADAQAAYNFHHLRDAHPALASNRVANQFWYSAFSCTSGWFCGTLQSVSSFSSIEVQQPADGGAWSTLVIPPSIKAFVLVNLQSYAGGRNIWGESESKKKKWLKPSVSDGLIEVVGFTHGYHAMAVMGSGAKLAHGKRLAQVHGIRLTLRQPVASADGGPGEVFMQLDGEPWLQKVPAGSMPGSDLVLEVVHAGVSKVLSNTSEPPMHPERKMTRMLTEKETEAYLTAPADPHKAYGSAITLPQQSSRSVRTSASSLEAEYAADDYPSNAAGRGMDYNTQSYSTGHLERGVEFTPVRPVSRGAGGLPSNSGSVSDPGCVPTSISGSGGVVAARVSEEPEDVGAGNDSYGPQVRNAISNPGTAPEGLTSNADDLAVGGSATGGNKVSDRVVSGKSLAVETPGVVALIGPMQSPGRDTPMVKVN